MTPFYYFTLALAGTMLFITLIALFPLVLIWRKQPPRPQVVVTPTGPVTPTTTTVTTVRWYDSNLLIGGLIVALVAAVIILGIQWEFIEVPAGTTYSLPGVLIFGAIIALAIHLIRKGDLPSAVAIGVLAITAGIILRDGQLSVADAPILLLVALFFAAWRGYLSKSLITAAILVGALAYWLGYDHVATVGRNLGKNMLSISEGQEGSLFDEWTVLDVAPNSVSPPISIKAHKNFCVRIVGAPDTNEFILSHTEIIPWGFTEWCPNDGGSFRKIRFVGDTETYTAQYKITDGSCN